MKKVLAVASGGGHWVQLMRLRKAFDDGMVTYMSTSPGYSADVAGRFVSVIDASMWEKWRLIQMFAQVAWHVLRIRPHVVLTTGAAPGFAAIVFGKLIGAKTIWVDSIANSEELSRSGQQVRRWADVWLTQWDHLSADDGPEYWGSVI